MKSYLTIRLSEVNLSILTWFVAFLAICSLAVGSEPNTAEPNAPAEPNTPVETVADPNKIEIAVTVNGAAITEADIDAQIAPQLEKMSTQLPPEFVEQFKKQLRQQALEKMIVEQLLEEKVKAGNIVVTEEEATEEIKEMASAQKPPLSLEEFKAKIEVYGKSFDEVKQQVRTGLGYQKIMEAQWADKINVTEDEAKKYYSENKSKFEIPEQVRASHILIKSDTTDPNADPNEANAKAKAKAEGLLKQIEDGADFAELAKANSACGSAASGGDLDFFGRGQMVPPFEKVAFESKVGQVSDIVETQFGYHIIKVTDHKDPNIISFEQAKDDILKLLKRNKQTIFTKEYIELLKAEANIVYPSVKEPEDSSTIATPAQPTPAGLEAPVEPNDKTKAK